MKAFQLSSFASIRPLGYAIAAKPIHHENFQLAKLFCKIVYQLIQLSGHLIGNMLWYRNWPHLHIGLLVYKYALLHFFSNTNNACASGDHSKMYIFAFNKQNFINERDAFAFLLHWNFKNIIVCMEYSVWYSIVVGCDCVGWFYMV